MNVSSIGFTPVPHAPNGSEAQVRNAGEPRNDQAVAAAPPAANTSDQRSDRPGQIVDKKV